MDARLPRAFDWARTHAVVSDGLVDHELRAVRPDVLIAGSDDAPELRIDLPAVLPRLVVGADPREWLAMLPERLGVEAAVLLRAGSAALGVWHDDVLVHHKVFKRYVVRGNGKAQAAHLRSKGKSRYGSRLRLQNAQRLLVEVNERLAEWELAAGPFETIHFACPVRLWADLMNTTPPPPFAADDPRLRKVTFHVHEPDFEELQRVRDRLRRGRVSSARDPAEPDA